MSDKKISQLTGATTPLAGTEELPIVQGGVTKKVSAANLTAGRSVAASNLTISGDVAIGTSITTGVKLALRGAQTSTLIAGDNGVNSGFAVKFAPNLTNIGNDFSQPLGFLVNDVQQAKLESTGNLTLNLGNLVIGTAGKGIDFSADPSAAGMTSELLDDYEEGTFTPVIVGATDAGAGTYTTQRGSYTKVGRLVTYNIGLGWTAHTGTGNMRITGLPFTVVEGAVVAIVPVNITVTGQVYGSLIAAETYMNIVAIDNGSLSFLTMDTAGSFFLTGFYYV